MADPIVGVDSGYLGLLAQSIRQKGGTSADLEFPNGFVSALQAITTEATVTPKITPQQKVLTPSDTSFSIDPGFHDGTGTVSIQTETGSANPTSTQQTYYPSAGKFFSSFAVGGTGTGYKVASGSVTVSRGLSMTISAPNFTPSGGIIVLNHSTGGNMDALCTCHAFDSNVSISTPGFRFSSRFASDTYVSESPSYGSVTFSGKNDIVYFEGTYNYFLYGS